MRNILMNRKKTTKELVIFLESNWPGKCPKDVRAAFTELKKTFNEGLPARVSASSDKEPSRRTFNLLDVVRRTCAAHDFLFLSRQLTYHVSANAELKPVAANEGHVEAVFSELIGHIVKRAPHGSRMDIALSETTLRHGPAIEAVFRSVDERTAEQSRAEFIDNVFGAKTGSSILACKEAIAKEGGVFTADLPEPKKPLFRVALRTIAATNLAAGDNQVFKYEITIRNISNVRKRFGIKKSESLVTQIESFVRSLVRHPIDIVTAMHDKGVVTAIYETQKGAAQSVAGRISARLGSEKFRIGKMEVQLDLKYELTSLPSIPLTRTGDDTGTKR